MIQLIKLHVCFGVLYTNLQRQAELAIFLQKFLCVKIEGNKLAYSFYYQWVLIIRNLLEEFPLWLVSMRTQIQSLALLIVLRI